MRSGRRSAQPVGAIAETLTAEQVWAACELVAESIPHIVWLSHPSGSIDYINTFGTDYTGLPREANYGWRWLELVHPDDAQLAGLGWERAMRTLTPFELTYRIRRSDGQFRWYAFRALPIRRPNGEILRWIGIADDVDDGALPEDDRARIERQTRELRALLEAAPTGSQGSVRLRACGPTRAAGQGRPRWRPIASAGAGRRWGCRPPGSDAARSPRDHRAPSDRRRLHERRDRQPPRSVAAQHRDEPAPPPPDPRRDETRRAGAGRP